MENEQTRASLETYGRIAEQIEELNGLLIAVRLNLKELNSLSSKNFSPEQKHRLNKMKQEFELQEWICIMSKNKLISIIAHDYAYRFSSFKKWNNGKT